MCSPCINDSFNISSHSYFTDSNKTAERKKELTRNIFNSFWVDFICDWITRQMIKPVLFIYLMNSNPNGNINAFQVDYIVKRIPVKNKSIYDWLFNNKKWANVSVNCAIQFVDFSFLPLHLFEETKICWIHFDGEKYWSVRIIVCCIKLEISWRCYAVSADWIVFLYKNVIFCCFDHYLHVENSEHLSSALKWSHRIQRNAIINNRNNIP